MATTISSRVVHYRCVCDLSRHMVTPGGYSRSVARTNCGRLAWVADRTGYRYSPVDRDTGAQQVIEAAGYPYLYAIGLRDLGLTP